MHPIDFHKTRRKTALASHVLYLVNAWLVAVTVQYLLLPKQIRPISGLDGIAAMSMAQIGLVAVAVYLIQFLLSGQPVFQKTERWIMPCTFTLYATSALINCFSWAFMAVCILVAGVMIYFARFGWNAEKQEEQLPQKESKLWWIPTAVLAMVFFCIVSAWTVARVFNLWTPTFDFGIFAQMFHYMKTTGIPFTTVERDGLLSHFAVHVSPVYYLMLPFYCLVPRPETLQVLQAAVLASSVIPLWKPGKHHGLHPGLRTAACALLVLYPALAGGTSYDIHENCFLTPLVLWLLYGIDRKNITITAVFAVLTLTVKEDAAVYVAIIGLYLLLRSLLHKDKWGMVCGTAVFALAVGWFLAVTHYLSTKGDGVMNYRYQNFMYDESNSLATVVKAVLLCPMKAIYECVDTEKLGFIALTLLPLLCLPLLTRRYERFVLLIPYVLINLMSDYTYQHNIMFQYTFGSTACLFYLVVVNLADIKEWKKYAVTALALCISFGCFFAIIIPPAKSAVSTSMQYRAYYDEQRAFLDQIPEDASVAATTFYTTYLSQRDNLHDIQYASAKHISQCEYVVIAIGGSFTSYAGGSWVNEEGFIRWLCANGYELIDELPDVARLYKKTA